MKSILNSLIILIIIHPGLIHFSYGQVEQDFINKPITFNQFLAGVRTGNLGYIAEEFNVDISEAALRASKIFPDPEVTVNYSNNEDRTIQMGQSVETGISYPVNLGNKRRAGIDLARSHNEFSHLILEAYFRNLRADAAISYFATLKDQKIHLFQKEIQKQLVALAGADSLRLKTGEATELDALQSSLEARSQLKEVIQSLADTRNSCLNLMILQGKMHSDTLDSPSDDFPVRKRNFDLNQLIDNALNNRTELMIAVKNREVSEKNLKLLRANRAFEFSLEAGYSYNSIVRNEIAPAPAHNSLSAGIVFPLKFSNFNKGSLQTAELAVKQNQTLVKETELQVTAEVIRAYNDFYAQDQKVENFNMSLIEDAGKILNGRIYSYQQGDSGLLDVLNAQRTYIELKINYIEALFSYTSALIELERASGIWDLSE